MANGGVVARKGRGKGDAKGRGKGDAKGRGKGDANTNAGYRALRTLRAPPAADSKGATEILRDETRSFFMSSLGAAGQIRLGEMDRIA